MKIAEVFARAEITSDTKARRVANVAPDQTANITADEIENGVTIERLETIGVPILKYSGQITIHGKLPEFSEFARPGGYKAVFQNQNGSIGVRYVALDAEKKKLICKAASYYKGPWSAHINSKGLEIIGFWHEKEPCLEAFKSFPRDLFAGGIIAFPGVYGGYYVEVAIGCIYEKDLWPLIAYCFGFTCPADLQTVIDERERQDAIKRAEWERERLERDARKEKDLATLASNIGLTPLRSLPKGECSFVRIVDTWSDGPKAKLYVIRKKAFGQLCYACRDWERGVTTFDPVRKMKRFDRSAIESAMAKGLVFIPA